MGSISLQPCQDSVAAALYSTMSLQGPTLFHAKDHAATPVFIQQQKIRNATHTFTWCWSCAIALLGLSW